MVLVSLVLLVSVLIDYWASDRLGGVYCEVLVEQRRLNGLFCVCHLRGVLVGTCWLAWWVLNEP